jgi:CheY-like chemotaxis protein
LSKTIGICAGCIGRLWVFAGFDVREAGDGVEALRQIEADVPDLIVLDLLLPVLGGVSVLQDVVANAHTKDISIVIVTGSAIEVSDADVACLLRKPVSPDALVNAVYRCINTRVRGAGS